MALNKQRYWQMYTVYCFVDNLKGCGGHDGSATKYKSCKPLKNLSYILSDCWNNSDKTVCCLTTKYFMALWSKSCSNFLLTEVS